MVRGTRPVVSVSPAGGVDFAMDGGGEPKSAVLLQGQDVDGCGDNE